ncbi:MAG: SDR family oxidoreductase [Hyphomicrobiales bacterium]|nr:SDR family oxidoreductase [Hyphomicrobiales bacterium]
MSDITIIVGGTGGVGSALARRLVAAGRQVHLIGRDPVKLSAIAGELGASSAVADVLDADALKATVEAAGPAVGGLAYAVGSINLKPVSRLTDGDFENDFRLNALGAVRAVQAALPALKAAHGTPCVMLFSTVAVAQGFTAHASVAMAKGAVEGLTLALAAELAPKIRVNCIAPSLTRTPLAKALTGNEQMATAIAQMHAMQRLGEADDIAATAAFLMSADAGWITGQIIGVDGGRSTLRTKG